MGRRRRSQDARAGVDAAVERQRRLLAAPILLLLLIGLLSSAYLLHLFIKVRSQGAGNVDSFCAVSDTLNCVTVANSTYSTFLGLPIALFALEFFLLAVALVAVTLLKAWRLRAWDSLIFDLYALSLPVCGLLAWISATQIRSLCLLCTAIYTSNGIGFLVLLVAGRRRLRSLLIDGPRELAGIGAGWGALLGLVVVVGLSQFGWAPGIIKGLTDTQAGGGGHESSAWEGLPASGLTLGPPGAPLKVEEFTDYQCPHCGNAHTVMMEVMRKFPGKVHLVHRDFPLDMACNPMVKRPFHPNACLAAYYGRCAAQQGKYWPLDELLFQNRERLEEPELRGLASRVGLDLERLARCVASPATQNAVLEDIREGLRRGVEGTPTLFVNGEKIVGMRPLDFWEERIREAERAKR
jgi:protein-disulfide isomerase/uncharacterized membrane protein